MATHPWSIIIHGGAGQLRPEREAASREGSCAAALAGAAVLDRGGTASEAVEAAVRVLENDPVFNAGYGSVLNADGQVEMDAAIMDGSTLDIGGVVAVMGIRNPISVAAAMLRAPPILLAADGAHRFAESVGAELCAPGAMIAPHRLRGAPRAGDTVGCVAMDRTGAIAAGTSTGGTSGKPPGRVGDVPLPGCGFLARTGLGGVSVSGDGEIIARVMLSALVMRGLETTDVEAAASSALGPLAELSGSAGIIALDVEGRPGWAHNTPAFAVAHMREGGEVAVFARKGGGAAES